MSKTLSEWGNSQPDAQASLLPSANTVLRPSTLIVIAGGVTIAIAALLSQLKRVPSCVGKAEDTMSVSASREDEKHQKPFTVANIRFVDDVEEVNILGLLRNNETIVIGDWHVSVHRGSHEYGAMSLAIGQYDTKSKTLQSPKLFALTNTHLQQSLEQCIQGTSTLCTIDSCKDNTGQTDLRVTVDLPLLKFFKSDVLQLPRRLIHSNFQAVSVADREPTELYALTPDGQVRSAHVDLRCIGLCAAPTIATTKRIAQNQP